MPEYLPPRTIVLVEDNPDDRELTVRALSRCRPQNPVVSMEDGAAAFEYLEKEFSSREILSRSLPALVLLDLKMPRLDGLEFLRRVRSNERTRIVPVVVMTSSGERRDIATAYQLGANSYITKPVEYEKFLQIVDCLCRYWLDYNEPPGLRTSV